MLLPGVYEALDGESGSTGTGTGADSRPVDHGSTAPGGLSDPDPEGRDHMYIRSSGTDCSVSACAAFIRAASSS
jgi:hypothetical protein